MIDLYATDSLAQFWLERFQWISYQLSDPCVCAEISRIATWQTLQLVRKKCMAKGCFDVKKTILVIYHRFFPGILSEMGVGNLAINFSPCARVWWNWLCVMISNFSSIRFKSPRNNSIEPFQFYLLVLSRHLAFFLAR